jgi:hypothetical protein
VRQHAERECVPGGALALEQRQQGTERGFHWEVIMPVIARADAVGRVPRRTRCRCVPAGASVESQRL